MDDGTVPDDFVNQAASSSQDRHNGDGKPLQSPESSPHTSQKTDSSDSSQESKTPYPNSEVQFRLGIPVVPVEQCFHRWLVRAGTGKSFRMYCKECRLQLTSPWPDHEKGACRHDKLDANGYNQYGLRLRCLKCRELVWENNAASQVWLHRSNTLTILGRDRITRSLFESTVEIGDPPSGPEDGDNPPRVINNPAQRK